MAQILRTTLIPDEAQAADGVINFDLPVNPLSVLLITVKAINAVGVGSFNYVADLLSMITNLNIRYRGATIVDGSLADLAWLNMLLTGWAPRQGPVQAAINDARSITVPICLGRRPYDPTECFPATRRGDLVLQMTTDVLVGDHSTMIIQAETVELLDASPGAFLKYTTTSKVSNAISEHDVELPIGNDLLGVLLQGPVVPNAGLYGATFGKVKLQVDNVETMFSETNWETLAGSLARRAIGLEHLTSHVHSYNAAAVATEYNTRPQVTEATLLNNYGYLDLDPLGDGQYALKTAGAARVNLRVTTEIASATAMRIMPVELVETSAAK